MKQFKVKVLRTVYESIDIEVWAESDEEALSKVAMRDYPAKAETVRDRNIAHENVIATFEQR